MDYHGRMMNIPYDRLQETFDKNDLTLTARRPYKFGHRDARHAAAEIATEADREIDRLRTENEQLRTDLEEVCPPNFTVDDVLSVKTALTKIGHATPESNDLSPGEVLSMFRRLANQVRAGLYEWMPLPKPPVGKPIKDLGHIEFDDGMDD